MTRIDERTPLLPINVVEKEPLPTDDRSYFSWEIWEPKKLSRQEYALIASISALAGFIASILNLSMKNPLLLCRFGLYQLAHLLPACLYIALPNCVVFLIAAPFVVQSSQVRLYRCGGVFCYLLVSFCAAWAFGTSVRTGNSVCRR
ncbi:hypothetical protein BU16DRAFT_223891 [Lophium mytilinum]|uniref:Uncharacterized protein n=1 Tax=Lophium mytilinum TaxID=390894 RepID=A0A6A6Q9G7_9PEZI|nr:hypothetical protein BU16DRAFT_223891 [Lophium mytilinum]